MINNSGIGVYIRHFIATLLLADKYLITLLGRKNELIVYLDSAKFQFVEANFPIYSITEQVNLPKLIPECDVFWSPHYNIPLLPIKAKRFLVTVPDVFHLAFYSTLSLSQKIYAKVVVNAAVRKADCIMTISDYSKDEIVRFTHVKASKITVIYLGLDRHVFSTDITSEMRKIVRNRYQIPEKYILFVGNVKPNKNLRALVDAFDLLSTRLPDYKLLIVGKKEGFITGDKALFDRIGNSLTLKDKVAFTGYVSNEDLPVLYNMASVFAFPSIYEGFGFPPLEAMACGCPVVASDRASIPEICGDGATYINPDDSARFADALFLVLTDEMFKSSLVANGFAQSSKYNWDEAGEAFVSEIQHLLTE